MKHEGSTSNGVHIPLPLRPEEDLLERRIEIINLFSGTNVTTSDEATENYQRLARYVGPSTEWETREAYIARCYLTSQADHLLIWAINTGVAPIIADIPGRGHARLDHRIFFGLNKWWSQDTIGSARYKPMNEGCDGEAGRLRAAASGLPLWIRSEDWDGVVDQIIRRREEIAREEFPEDRIAFKRMFAPTDQNKMALPPPIPSTGNGPYWSLYEAVAWIGSRDQSLVDRQQQRERLGNRPEQSGAIAWKRLEKSLDDRIAAGADAITAEIARERLRLACERGSVQATGVPADRGDRRVVPAADFISAELWEGRGGTLHRIVANRGEPARWLDLRFGMDDVRRLDRGDARSDGLSQVEAAPPPLPKKKGRPPSYDWPGAIAALTEVDGRDDLFARILANDGPTQADAERFVAEWFELREQSPGEASVRRHVGALLQSRRESNAAKAQKEGS